jgi:Pregnancy-associated plasma protein-A/Secretion system C-terminal sorting domain
MKHLLLTFCLSAMLLGANAQTTQHKCGFDEAQHDLATAQPNYAQEVAAYKQSLNAISQTQALQTTASLGNRTPEAVLTIPVVFHIIHSGETVGTGRNISLARIQQQVAQLNADYGKTNTDISQLPAQFNGIAANCEVQFCLAAIDPLGSPTTGITRHSYPSIANRQYIENTIKPATTWNAQRYLNVWVCEMPQTAGGGFVLGYAYLPTASMVGSNIDGFVVDYTYVGTNAAVGSKGRTATHEIGHYLGLPHPWGSNEGDCPGSAGYEDDNIADTPPTSEPNYTPASGVCNFTPTFCANTVFGSNFMDYANDDCMHAFSTGQKNVMRNILTGLRAQLTNNAATTCALVPVSGCADPVTTAFTMGFETTENITGWVTENTNNDTNTAGAPVTWGIASGQQTDGDYGPFTGNQYARYFYNDNGTTAANDWLFSPCLNLKTGRSYTLRFYTAVGSTANPSAIYPEKLICYLNSAQNSASTSIVRILRDLGTVSNAYPNYQQTIINFTVTTTGNYYIGFKCYSAANNYILTIDDINLSGIITSTEGIDFENDVKIYPNPVTDILTLEVPDGTPLKNATVTVTDMLGRNLYESPLRSGEYRHFINPTSEWANGVYLLTLYIDGTRTTKRFVVNR